MKKAVKRVSLGDIAREAGVSRVTACYVMRNRPGPSDETRARIQKIAKDLGYVPDARVTSWMAKVRDAKEKDLLPIAWLSTHEEKDAWKKYQFLAPYYEGACARAEQMGYRIENICADPKSISMKRISQIVHQRGIEGVILTHPAHHFNLKWNTLAAVAIERYLFAPRLHRIMTDLFFNLQLALKMVQRFGYRRIGICLDQKLDRNSFHGCRAAIHDLHAKIPKSERVTPLFYKWTAPFEKSPVAGIFAKWLKDQRPDVVVVHNSYVIEWAEAAGYRVPKDLGIVHLATDDDVSDWAGICSHRRKIGAAAAEWVISLLQNRQFGIPDMALNTMVRGTWHEGRTLLIPKPK